MSKFFPGYADIFKQGDTWYGFPKDGNTIAMAYNTDSSPDRPPRWTSWSPGHALKGTAG